MKTNRIFLFAALLGTVLVGCQKETEITTNEEQPDPNQTWTLKVQVSKTTETKALDMGTSTGENPHDIIVASWKNGEKVAVYFGENPLGTLEVTSADGVNPATLEGQITKPGNLDAGSSLTLLFPGREDNAWTYLGQDGKEPSPTGTLGGMFDYALATLKVENVAPANQTININESASSTTFETQQSVYRFGFKIDSDSDGVGDGDNLAVKSFTLSTSGGDLVRSFTTGAWSANKGPVTLNVASGISSNIYYMAVCNQNTGDETYNFSVVCSDDALYEGTKAIAAAAHGVGKLISARNIVIAKKTVTPSSTKITNDNDVL